MKKERSKWEIIMDVLKVTKEEKKAKKTRIMQKAYLDWKNFQRYYDFLLEEGFITRCIPESDCYELTEKGRNLLTKMKEVSEILRDGSAHFQYSVKIFPAAGQKATAAELSL